MTRRASIIVVASSSPPSSASRCSSCRRRRSTRRPTLGLDLQGGLEVTLQAVPPKGRKLTKEDLDRSVAIMRDRVDRLGVAEPEIRKQGDDQITIQLPGVKDPETAAKIIGKTAQLELFDLEANLRAAVDRRAAASRSRRSRVYDLLAGQQALVAKGDVRPVLARSTRRRSSSPARSRPKEAALGASTTARCRRAAKLFAVPPEHGRRLLRRRRGRLPGRAAVANPTSNSYYLFKLRRRRTASRR